MSRSLSLLQFRTAAREATGTVGNTFIGDAWLTTRVNAHIADVWDRLVDAGPPERIAATETYTEVAGTPSVPLPALFRSFLDAYLVESSGERIPLREMRGGTRGNYRAPSTSYVVEIEYIQTAPVLVDDGEAFDGICGWEDLIVKMMARDIAEKRDVSPDAFLADIQMLQARIESRARSFNKGSPKYVTDLDDVHFRRPWSLTPSVSTYRLRGENLELYESAWP